jgi:putative restriction endonuclease
MPAIAVPHRQLHHSTGHDRWWPKDEVFAGFDYRRHSGSLGGSPSFQISLCALRAAATEGFAVHPKRNGELAIAFRADFISTYVDNLEVVHDTGRMPAEVTSEARFVESPTVRCDC